MNNRRTSRSGFTLIELMIVIAIIAIIAAIAIPNLLDARKAANEASAIASLRAIHSAQNVYREQDKDGNGTLDYAGNIGILGTYGLIDAQLGGPSASDDVFGPKQGYAFFALGQTGPTSFSTLFTWSIQCVPEEVGDSGDRRFFVDQGGVLRYTIQAIGGGAACADWPALGK